MEQSYQSLAREYRDLMNKSGDQCGDELHTTLTRLKEIEQLLREMTAAIPRCTGGSTNYKNERPDKWVNADINPTQWAKQENGVPRLRPGCHLNGRFKVKLADGREIFTWWQDGQWSVERLKPHLKVAFWERPVWIA